MPIGSATAVVSGGASDLVEDIFSNDNIAGVPSDPRLLMSTDGSVSSMLFARRALSDPSEGGPDVGTIVMSSSSAGLPVLVTASLTAINSDDPLIAESNLTIGASDLPTAPSLVAAGNHRIHNGRTLGYLGSLSDTGGIDSGENDLIAHTSSDPAFRLLMSRWVPWLLWVSIPPEDRPAKGTGTAAGLC
jgi:hypothetical protein